MRCACVSLAVLILTFVGKTIALYFLIWLLGAALNRSRSRPAWIQTWFRILVALGFAASLCVFRFHLLASQEVTDFLIGSTFCGVMLAVLHSNLNRTLPTSYVRLSWLLSRFSYTLYLVHLPWLAFLNACWIGKQPRWQLDPWHLVLIGGVALLTLVLAGLVWTATEAHTDAVRRAALRWLAPRTSGAR